MGEQIIYYYTHLGFSITFYYTESAAAENEETQSCTEKYLF